MKKFKIKYRKEECWYCGEPDMDLDSNHDCKDCAMNIGDCIECGEEGPRNSNGLCEDSCAHCNECGKVERQYDGPSVCEDCYAYLLSIAK